MSLVSGVRLGPYQIIACVGVGGMGEVYRATDTRLGRDVALKVLPDGVAGDPDRLARFEREAKTLASLNHPNIAHIYGLEDSGTVHAIVLEFVEGPTLADRLAHGSLPVADAREIGRQIALALEAAHDQSVVHRDLKPANVKVREDGTVKVLDFGLAKAMAQSEGAALRADDQANTPTVTLPTTTRVGTIVGTAAYMSPEQARGKTVDQRADVWAFGCVLHEMLSGRRAFQGENVHDTLAAVLADAPDANALPAGLPESLRRLLRRCLEKDPRNRLSSIRDARLDLEESDDAAGVPSAPAVRSRSRIAALLAAAAVGSLVTASAAWFLQRGTPANRTDAFRSSLLVPDGTDLSSDGAGVAVSPNGEWMAFVTGAAGSATQLWVRAIGDLTPRPLPDTDGARLPFWSPDSRHLGFFARGQLKTVPVEGGRARVVSRAGDGQGGAWNAADVIVFSETISGPLMRVSAAGGVATPVTTLDAVKRETNHRFPSFLPDGDHFLFVVFPARGLRHDVSIGSLTSGARESLGTFESAPVYAPPGYLLFTRGGVLVAQPFDPSTRRLSGEPVALDDAPGGVAFNSASGPVITVSSNGLLGYVSEPPIKTRLVWLDESGTPTGVIDSPPAHYREIRISPDGRRAAVVRQELPTESSIWLIDLVRGGMMPVTTFRGRHWAPAWAPDSARLFFTTNRDGSEQIYLKNVDDRAPELPVFPSRLTSQQPASVSSEDELVFQILSPITNMDIWKVPLTGPDRAAKVLIQTRSIERNARISPDGHWLAYSSTVTGREEIWVAPFPKPNKSVQITSFGATLAAWRQDSRQLIVIGMTGPFLVDVFQGNAVSAGRPRPFFTGPSPVGAILTGDISPDFTRFLAAVREGNTIRPSLTIVTGWAEALAKR